MQNTYHYLTYFAPKMCSIIGTVSFTDSTVYSESIGWIYQLPMLYLSPDKSSQYDPFWENFGTDKNEEKDAILGIVLFLSKLG